MIFVSIQTKMFKFYIILILNAIVDEDEKDEEITKKEEDSLEMKSKENSEEKVEQLTSLEADKDGVPLETD